MMDVEDFVVPKYPKIQSVFKRDQQGDFIMDKFTTPEFEYLYKNEWVGTEKIDGTNIRIHWNANDWSVDIRGRTDNAQIPPHLMERLQELFGDGTLLKNVFGDTTATLYGEGFGNKIQKVGKQYLAESVDFILFDVQIGRMWLRYFDVLDIAQRMNIRIVPIIFRGTLEEAIDKVVEGFESTIGEAKAEGLVLKPSVNLLARNGQRIITKLKTKDFEF